MQDDEDKADDHDPVNHPRHYTRHPSGVECIQVVEHMGFNLGNAIKYLWRADLKGDAIQDLEKAAWYINREIERRSVAPPEPERIELVLEMSPPFLRFLDQMAVEMGVGRTEAFRQGLGLLRIALDAKREGNKLAIVTPDLEFDQEITGF